MGPRLSSQVLSASATTAKKLLQQQPCPVPPPPVLVVLGATGAGKSQLALELAQHFGGQIVSADAMQMYRGLDIVTNKVTKEEMSLVRHHVIDFLDPLDKHTVVQFRNKALPIVQDLLKQNIMPVICGGTNYYIESLLWKVLIDQGEGFSTRTGDATVGKIDGKDRAEEEKEDDDKTSFKRFKDDIDFDDESVTNTDLLEKLREVDPGRAAELHPHDRRKIIRSLQVYNRSGKPHSQLISEQKSQVGAGPLGGPLRFDHCLVIWVQCDQAILDERCNRRVDKMMDRGMIKELEEFHEDYNSKRTKPADYTVGIFQSIGFKEFHDYLLLAEDEKSSAEVGPPLLAQGLEQLKTVTRQYARRQLKWLRHRFLNPDRRSPEVYAVDSSCPERWKESCFDPAVEIVQALLEGKEPEQKPVPLMPRNPHNWEDKKKVFRCEGCDKFLNGVEQYEIHMKSKKHRRQGKKSIAVPKKVSIVVEKFDSERKMETLKILKDKSGLPLSEVKKRLEEEEDNVQFDLGLSLEESEAKLVLEEFNAAGIVAKLANKC